MKSQRLAQRLTLSILHSQENSVSKMRTHFDITTDFIFILFIYVFLSFFFIPRQRLRDIGLSMSVRISIRPEP